MLFMLCFVFFFFFFKQKTAYEMRISDWSSDVCSSDLGSVAGRLRAQHRCRQGHAAQLGAWSQASQRPRPGAARHDREEALAGERAAALTAFMADSEAGPRCSASDPYFGYTPHARVHPAFPPLFESAIRTPLGCERAGLGIGRGWCRERVG